MGEKPKQLGFGGFSPTKSSQGLQEESIIAIRMKQRKIKVSI
jgi:hypothetical protein